LFSRTVNHLDLRHQLSILDLIGKLNRQDRMTVVAVFHDLNLAAEYCDRLLILDRGQIAALGSPRDVLTTETIRRVYGVMVSLQRNPLSDKPCVVVAGGLIHRQSTSDSPAASGPPHPVGCTARPLAKVTGE
jgi:iron complex transport system ATP-binding protein